MSVRLLRIFRFLIAAMFIFSAIAKLLSLPFFDGMVAELFIGKDYFNYPTAMFWMQLFTRSLIAGELLLGLAVLQNRMLKSIVLPAIFIMLAAFTLHLFFAAIVLGKGFIGGNCGCFGDLVPMDNLESILKNIVIMGMVAYVWKYVNIKRDKIKSLTLVIITGVVCFATLLLTMKNYTPKAEMVDYSNQFTEQVHEEIKDTTAKITEIVSIEEEKQTENPVEKTANIPQPTTKVEEVKPVAKPQRLFDAYTNFSNGQKANLYVGEKLICMFSVTCGHCQETYKDIVSLISSGKLPPVYLLNYGSEIDQEYFFSQVGAKHPHILIKDYTAFQKLLEGNDFPRVMHIKDGKVLAEWNLDTYSKEAFKFHFGLEKLKNTSSELQLNIQNSKEESLFGDY